MRGMPFNLQGKGGLEVVTAAAEARILWSSRDSKKEGVEPRSVLDHRRSPSPPTSTSTLSSSLGGGGGSTDTAGVAALSDKPPHKWPPSQDTNNSAAAAEEGRAEVGGGGREEWGSEFHPITAGLEIGLMGGDKCGLGMEDFETMLSETPATASPGQEQSFLTWIMSDVDDPSSVGFKQHSQHHMLLQGPLSVEFETGGTGAGAGAGGFGLVDPVFGFEPLGVIGGGGVSGTSMNPLLPSSAGVSSGLGFPLLSGNNSGNGNSNSSRIVPMSQSSSPFPGLKLPYMGNSPNAVFSPPPATGNSLSLPLSLPPGVFYQEEEKPQFYSPNLFLNQQQQVQPPQNPSFFLPLSPYAQAEHQTLHLHNLHQPKRHHSFNEPTCQMFPKVPFSDSGQDLFLRRNQQPPAQQQPSFGNFNVIPQNNLNPQRPMKPKMVGGDEGGGSPAADHQQQHQALLDQLLKAAEQVEAGNSVNARGILARLNHHLSPIGKPLIRSAFYFKEALHSILNGNPNTPPSSPPPPPNCNPMDVVQKLSAYKAFSEVSPILQFTNFTCIQALLEELHGADHIHIIDFDIGVGGQWSSFMQELSQRSTTTAAPSLKITAFVSHSSFHPLELDLTRGNLTHFARDLSIPFEFNILSLDSFNPAGLLHMPPGSDEVIAVNLPVGVAYPSISTLLRLVKQLSPKIVVSVNHACNRGELSFSHHFFHAFQSCNVLLESIDAAGVNPEVSQKIEQYLIQPRIESSVMGRHRSAEKTLPWRNSFVSAGFVPVPFSNFTETQAECLLKRTQVRGFHVEKHQASLLLCWQRGELVAVSAWRC